MFIWVHVAASVSALLLGGTVLALRKGTPRPVLAGWLYTASMVVLGLSSFGIYEVSGSFSIFHAITIQGLVFVSAGIVCARFLRKRLGEWQVWHARFMVYSYITLAVTGTAQFFDRLPIENPAIRAIIF